MLAVLAADEAGDETDHYSPMLRMAEKPLITTASLPAGC